ncbi:hypothetical protein RCL1_004817 [Eukaryota sp. TZLM3-RCL]
MNSKRSLEDYVDEMSVSLPSTEPNTSFLNRLYLFCDSLSSNQYCEHVLEYLTLISHGDFDLANCLLESVQSFIGKDLYDELVSLMTPSLCGTALVTLTPQQCISFESPCPSLTLDPSPSASDFKPLMFTSSSPRCSVLTRRSQSLPIEPISSCSINKSSESLTPVTMCDNSHRGKGTTKNRMVTHWSPEEDTKLIEAVEKAHRIGWTGWKDVAKEVGNNRTADSCSQR